MLILSNQERFKNSASIFSEDIVNRYSRIDWIPITSIAKQEHIF